MDRDRIISIIDRFAAQGMVFSNEQNFQFEFARALGEDDDVVEVRLEELSLSLSWDEVERIAEKKGKIARDKKEYTDLVVKMKNGEYIAIELKYKTPDKICCYDTQRGKVLTMIQGAYDFNAYDFIMDISRLETINERYFCNGMRIAKGYAIILTNYNQYRTNDFSKSSIWKNYSICEGKELKAGPLYFREIEIEYETKGRTFSAISLRNTYQLNWNDYKLSDYSDYEDKEKSYHPGFSYLIVDVNP